MFNQFFLKHRLSPTQKVALVFALCGTPAVITGILINMKRMRPVKEGASESFWRVACGVYLQEERRQFIGGGFVLPEDAGFFYDDQHLHGSTLYWIESKQVMADWTRVQEKLEERAASNKENDPVKTGYLAWKKNSEDGPPNIRNLVEQICESRVRIGNLTGHSTELYVYLLGQRVDKARHYFATVLFEVVYFVGMVWFFAWPGLKATGAASWGIHFGLMPLFVMFPAYLGYATMSTTSIGPSGGVLYPYLLSQMRGGHMTAIDREILRGTPSFLEPISQDFGPPLVYTGAPFPAPLETVGAGVLLGAVVSIVFIRLKRSRGREQARLP